MSIPPKQVKRKRGRPRKNPFPSPELEEEYEEICLSPTIEEPVVEEPVEVYTVDVPEDSFEDLSVNFANPELVFKPVVVEIPKNAPRTAGPYAPDRDGVFLNLDDSYVCLNLDDEFEADGGECDVVVPFSARWFSYNRIDVLEKRSFPEFFNSSSKSKTPAIYFLIRNFIIDSYRLNPARYFSVGQARNSVYGDIFEIFRIHNFLSYWKIINTQFGDETDSRTHQMTNLPNSIVLEDVSQGLQPLNFNTSTDNSSVESYFFENQWETESSPDFKKTINYKTPWTDEEVLLLLEALEKFTDDWPVVADYVKTRSMEDCIGIS